MNQQETINKLKELESTCKKLTNEIKALNKELTKSIKTELWEVIDKGEDNKYTGSLDECISYLKEHNKHLGFLSMRQSPELLITGDYDKESIVMATALLELANKDERWMTEE